MRPGEAHKACVVLRLPKLGTAIAERQRSAKNRSVVNHPAGRHNTASQHEPADLLPPTGPIETVESICEKYAGDEQRRIFNDNAGSQQQPANSNFPVDQDSAGPNSSA